MSSESLNYEINPHHWCWRQGEFEGTSAVIFDIDGVLADAAGRQHLLTPPKRDWEEFFSACGQDPIIEEVTRLLDVIDPNLKIILLTGRPVRVRPQTLDWLERFNLRWDLLIMRDFGDHSAATSFKEVTVNELKKRDFKLLLALEDDKRNLEMFNYNDIPCVYIHSGYYD